MNVVILAAGMGKRMQSSLPKVLHSVAGKPLLKHVIDTARSLNAASICVIYGHGGDQVLTAVAADDLRFARQEPQLGTGHAVAQAIPVLDDSQPTLVLYGDVPLTTAATLQRLISVAGNDKLAILTAEMAILLVSGVSSVKTARSVASLNKKMRPKPSVRSLKLIPAS
jgi:bifunctional UDP-N-acetylglucosamine pyrophosphorylase/glucosamine-1-phosphate N-acetyltransferase